MPVDLKYGQVTTEHGEFYPDEPVFVLRGRDALSVIAIDLYALLCRQNHSPVKHIGLIQQNIKVFEHWQKVNPDKVRIPTSAAYFERMGEQGSDDSDTHT